MNAQNRAKRTLLLKSYSTVTRAVAPALPLWLHIRAQKGREIPGRLAERYGISEYDRPDGKLVWMHAASVGESQMLMPLLRRIRHEMPGTHILMTTGTVTSAELLARQLPDNTVHQYIPADHPKTVKSFLSHWQPDLAIFAESELWPNIIMQSRDQAIPMVLLNARMSAKSIRRWEKYGKESGRALLACFDLILAADRQTADRLISLTGQDIENTGNLKDAAPTLIFDPDEARGLKTQIGRRPVWCAASTHKGEEDLIAAAVAEIKKKKPGALLLLAPRHPERVPDIMQVFFRAGLKVHKRSDGCSISDVTDVFIFDIIGKTGLMYATAPVSFIGGSLIKGLSGHNPLEPARLGSAVITGNHTASFADTYMALLAFGGAKRILTPADIAPAVLHLMNNEDARTAQVDAALRYAKSRDAVLDYVWDQLLPLLPEVK